MVSDYEDKPVKRQPARKKRPVVVQAKFIPTDSINIFSKKWFNYGRYIDRKTAESVITKEGRKKTYMEFRIKGD